MTRAGRHITAVLLSVSLAALLLSVLPLSPATAYGQIVSDAMSGTSGSAATLSWSHTVGSGTNRILVVGVSIRRSNRTVSSITYGPATLTRVGFQNSATNIARMEMWCLLDPPSGAGTITVTLAGASDAVGGAVSFSGIDPTTPLGAFASAGGTGATGSLTTSSASGELVVDVVAAPGTALSLTPGGAQATNWNTGTGTAGNDVQGASSSATGALSVTTSWSLGVSTDWAIGAVSLKPAPYPNIVLSLAQDNSAPSPATTVTYTISYTNLGNGPAGNSLIAFSPPANTTLVSTSVMLNGVPKTVAADGDEVTLSGSTVTVNLGMVPAGASGMLTYSVVIQ